MRLSPLKKIVLIVGLFLATFASLYLWRYPVARASLELQAARTLAAVGNPPIVLIGDSRIESWRPFCEGVDGQVWNIGISGTTAAFWKEYLNNRHRSLPKNSTVVMWMGVNDVMNHGSIPPKTAKSIVGLMQEFSSRDIRVFALGQIPVFAEDGSPREEINLHLKALDGIAAHAAIDIPGVQFVDLYSMFAAQERYEALYSDGIHLTDEGNNLLCEVAEGRLEW